MLNNVFPSQLLVPYQPARAFHTAYALEEQSAINIKYSYNVHRSHTPITPKSPIKRSAHYRITLGSTSLNLTSLTDAPQLYMTYSHTSTFTLMLQSHSPIPVNTSHLTKPPNYRPRTHELTLSTPLTLIHPETKRPTLIHLPAYLFPRDKLLSILIQPWITYLNNICVRLPASVTR